VTNEIADLVLPLINGAYTDPPWQEFLDLFRIRIDARYACMFFRTAERNRFSAPARSTLMQIYSGDADMRTIVEHWDQSQPLANPVAYHRLVEGQVYAMSDLLDLSNAGHKAFYREMMQWRGIEFSCIMRCAEPSGLSMWLSVSRTEKEFAARERALIGALAPYLRAALRAYATIERERYSARLSEDVIRRLNYGWIALDEVGRVIEADAQGERLLSQSGILRRDSRGFLTARPSSVANEIAAAVKEMVADPQRAPKAIILGRDPWLDMLLVRAGARPIKPGRSPALIAYVNGDSWSSANRCDQLAEMFQLLPSEARLALALSRGLSIAEAAEELGITIQTARSYSKKIYNKTGARGQPDLIRFIHRSVLAIA